MNELRKKMMLRLSTFVVLTASFAVISATILLGQNLQKILTLWGESLQMTVYLSENISAENATEIETSLKSNHQIDQVKFVTKETALGQFQEQMASYAPELIKDQELLQFIPSSFQLSMSKEIASDQQLTAMSTLAEQLKQKTGVEEVSYGQDWVKNYSQVTNALKTGGLVLALIILFSALFVISNCIRSSIYQRKEEIEVLELIGATARYIRKPFLIEGMALCGLSVTAGVIFCYGLFLVFQESLKSELAFLRIANHIQFISPQVLVSFGMGSLIVGYGAALICLKSLNDGWAASQKVKNEN